MSITLTIQEPVTGDEELRDLRQPLQALSEFYRALNARDLQLMEQNWDNSDQAAMDNPLGGIKRGWQDIKAVYEKLFALDGTYHFEFFDYTLHQFADVFYVVGRERGSVSKGGKELSMKIRTTRVFRLDGERWKQVHHHGSIEDAKLLEDYRAAVL